jgi:integrase
VPLSAPAVQLLVSMKEKAGDSPYLFPGEVADEPLQEIKWGWAKVCKQAKIENVRIHDLRHTYASHLVSSGMSPPIVGEAARANSATDHRPLCAPGRRSAASGDESLRVNRCRRSIPTV